MRVAALEDNVAFLEEWCEEQQDILDRTAGPLAYDYEPAARAVLRVVDLRVVDLPQVDLHQVDLHQVDLHREPVGEGGDELVIDGDGSSAAVFAAVETEHDRKIRRIRARIDRLRTSLEAEGGRDADAGRGS